MKGGVVELDVLCQSCDSTFRVSYHENDTIGSPQYCPFCNESLDEDDLDEDREQEIDVVDDMASWPDSETEE